MLTLFNRLFDKVDASSLAVFRIGLGALLVFDSINQFFLCLHCKYVEPSFLFKYHYFEWVQPWSETGLYLHWVIMTIAAIAIMLGYYYRLAIVIFTLGFSHAFLLDEALYLNHYYMVILFCIIMIFLPANVYWALDARRKPSIASAVVPRWAIVVLILQLEIILIHAGLAKLNPDWLNLEPLRVWMHVIRPQFPPWFTTVTSDAGIALGAYGAIALHLLGAPLLFFRRSRIWVVAVYACFHMMNHFVFNIGIFPWFTLFATTLFFEPDWPKTLWNKLANSDRHLQRQQTVPAVSLSASKSDKTISTGRWFIVCGLVCWLTVQALVPLRHWLYPGNVAWNEDGHRFSWRMKLRAKQGFAGFKVISGEQIWRVNPADYLYDKQVRKMVCIPDMLWQFAQYLDREWDKKGYPEVEVYLDSKCSLNNRKLQPMVAPDINLLEIDRTQLASDWLLPMTTPLKNPIW